MIVVIKSKDDWWEQRRSLLAALSFVTTANRQRISHGWHLVTRSPDQSQSQARQQRFVPSGLSMPADRARFQIYREDLQSVLDEPRVTESALQWQSDSFQPTYHVSHCIIILNQIS